MNLFFVLGDQEDDSVTSGGKVQVTMKMFIVTDARCFVVNSLAL